MNLSEQPELHTDDPRRGCGRCAHSTITGDPVNCGGCDDCAYFHGDGPDAPMGLGPLDVLALCIPFNAANCEPCGHVWPTGCHFTEAWAHWDEAHPDADQFDTEPPPDWAPPAAVTNDACPPF